MLEELKHPDAPEPIRDWLRDQPRWLQIMKPKSIIRWAQLDLGECEAIALASEIKAEVLLIDDLAGRQEAIRCGLRIAGTLSVLDEADQAGLADFEQAVDRLSQTSFRISRAVLADMNERRSR